MHLVPIKQTLILFSDNVNDNLQVQTLDLDGDVNIKYVNCANASTRRREISFMSPLCDCEQHSKRSILIANSQACLLERFRKTLKT